MSKIMLFLIILSLNLYSINRYVSPTGSDAAAGTVGAPWQHIAYGTSGAGAIHAGDTLFLNSGTYKESVLNILNSGTAGNPIVIKADHGAIPIIQGDTTATQGTIVPIWRIGSTCPNAVAVCTSRSNTANWSLNALYASSL